MNSVLRFRAPPSLRPADRSLWLDQAETPYVADVERVPLPARCDVCVVGGGFTGLWTAIHLKLNSPSTEVTLLEAGVCGGGASGRNGGFVMTAWSKFGTLAQLCGTEAALTYARAAERAIGKIGAFCADSGIDAEFLQEGWLWTATNQAQLDAWKFTTEQLAHAGETPYEILEPEEVARRSGSPVHLAGVFEAAPATIHPGRLARGLTRAARDLGVIVIEGCTVNEARFDGIPVLDTEAGTLRAGRVVLAISAWAAGVPEARRSLVVIASDVIATAPVPQRLEEIGWVPGLSISDSRRLVNYYRTTADGRIVFGKGGGDIAIGNRITRSFDRSQERAAEVLAQFHRIYPMLSDVAMFEHWRGAVDYSATGVPFVGPLASEPRLLIAAGFSGNGVGPSYVAGRALAQMALEREVDELPEGLRSPRPGRMPPEPMRYLAGRFVRETVRRKEDAEDRGRPPGTLLKAVASLDPTSFTDKGPATSEQGAQVSQEPTARA